MLELDLVLVMDALEDLSDRELMIVQTYAHQLIDERVITARMLENSGSAVRGPVQDVENWRRFLFFDPDAPPVL